MRILEGAEKYKAEQYIQEAATLARKAGCGDAHCGAVIVKKSEIIGRGFNSPPMGTSANRCQVPKSVYHSKVTDKTCCIHAEIRAIRDALRRGPDQLAGSALYFVRIDEQGQTKRSGDPYCTLCSKLVLDAGIQTFI
ncbi:MAG: deaminase, partial [Candidatus Moraniibacteriota bacterium]